MSLTSIADIHGPDFEAMIARARGISAQYDNYIENIKVDKRSVGIHASEIAGCRRKIVYCLLAYEQRGSLSKNWRQRFQVGHAIHGLLQSDFTKMAAQSGGLMEFEDEIKISPELQPLAEKWYITSSADGRFTIRDVPGGPPVLRIGLEIKTEAPDGYSKLTAPKEEHIDQAHIYMACLDVPVFWFLYINKGNQNNTGSDGPFFITFDHDRWARIEQKMAECHDAAEKNELPPREESMVCQFCPYAYTCQPPSQGRSNRKLVPLWRP